MKRVIYLSILDLKESSNGKLLTNIGLSDFNLTDEDIFKADKIVFQYANQEFILKDREGL